MRRFIKDNPQPSIVPLLTWRVSRRFEAPSSILEGTATLPAVRTHADKDDYSAPQCLPSPFPSHEVRAAIYDSEVVCQVMDSLRPGSAV